MLIIKYQHFGQSKHAKIVSPSLKSNSLLLIRSKKTFFQTGKLLFKQCIVTLMSINQAPFWENCLLHSYVKSCNMGLVISDEGCAMKGRYATHFIHEIDGSDYVNDDWEFGRSFRKIPPDNLEENMNRKELMPHSFD